MIQLYGQEYDDSDPMLGDYADLAQKGFGLLKKFGQGGKKLIKKIAARVRARRKGKGKATISAATKAKAAALVKSVRTSPVETSSTQPMIVDAPKRGLPGWALPAGVAVAAYFLLTRRGD